MPSRILLINANRCATPDPVFPLGLAYLAAALRGAGHECQWLDRLAHPEDMASAVRRLRPDAVGISLRNIDDVLIRKQETFFDELAGLGAQLRRERNCPIILGGSGFSIFPRELLELSGADYGIVGEGESALLNLIAALESGADPHTVPGLVFRDEGRVTINPACASQSTPELGPADRPPDVTSFYLRNGSMLNVQTQRGCSFKCCYCTYPLIEGRRHRRRPPDWIAAEFEQIQRLGARYVFIVDSVFNSSPHHVVETCEALLRRNNKLPWGCFLRPQGLTREVMRLMRQAGLAHIEFGSDSLCDEVLQAYHKGFTFDEICQASEMARQEEIDHCHYLIAGGPGETEATLEQGFQNSQRLVGAVIMAVAGMRVYPGTHLFEQAVAEGRIAHQANLLQPAYYLAPALTTDGVMARLESFAHRCPNWIVGDPDPSYRSLVARLRQRGIAGPLWSYFSLIQQLRPDRLVRANS